MFSRTYRTAVTVPPLAWVSVFLLVPYLLMFCYSFWSVSASQTIVHAWDFHNYKDLLTKSVYGETLLRSMWIAARVMLFSLLLGYPLAYFLSFYAGKRKDLLYQMVIIPSGSVIWYAPTRGKRFSAPMACSILSSSICT